MNPAVRDKETLLQFQKKAHQLIILRMITEEENVFQPYEKNLSAKNDLNLNTWYKKWFSEEVIDWQSRQFEYILKEEIDQEIFHLYFEEEYSLEQRQQMVQHVFGEALTVESQTKITFELLLA